METVCLDILASGNHSAIADVNIDDAGRISDHRLTSDRQAISGVSFLRIAEFKSLTIQFEQELPSPVVCKNTTTTADTFVGQLADVITSTLDVLAAVRSSKQVSKYFTCHV
jgi:hypothetical protein